MANSTLTPEVERALRRAAWVYPQPVAVACGGVLRSRTPQERLDAVLRAGEVLARYLAVVAAASFAARTEESAPPETPPQMDGALSFGHFLSLAQFAARSRARHPLTAELGAGFCAEVGEGSTGDALLGLLQLRNDISHQLKHLSEVFAEQILTKRDPAGLLASALGGVERLLSYPLLVVEEQRIEDDGVVVARMLYLMGESADPEPRDVEVEKGFGRRRIPYLGTPAGMTRLHPLLLWDIAEERQNYGLFIVDACEPKRIVYKPVSASRLVREGEIVGEVSALLAGIGTAPEPITQRDGSSLFEYWRTEYQRLSAVAEQREGLVPWDRLDDETIAWYAARLEPEATDVRAVVRERLLDGRDQFRPQEIAQVVLLFGRDAEVRAQLGRELLDLRAVGTAGTRWSDRVESHANVLKALRTAVDFLARHVGVDGVTLDGLHATTGSADYVAVREALINLFIHQDYADASAAAQVEVAPERTTFFNTGKSLVSATALLEGGKSQARNPLIARALRLIGFAELAGSGLRELQRVWRGAKRRPPRIESSPAANTFSLTLDWRPVPDVYDRFWKNRIGVRLNEHQATILNLALDPAGVGPAEAASATGLDLASAEEALGYLKLQVLVEQRKSRYYIRPDLRELVGSGAGEALPAEEGG